MGKVYRDGAGDLRYLAGKKVAVLGYGNQGRSQALNLRDSGVEVAVGSGRKDDSERQAVEDGFGILSFEDCARTCDILMLLLPDELLPQIYEDQIRPHLRPGQVLCFASGYNVCYKLIDIPEVVDVILLAPRMIGREVRDLFVQGSGAPVLVGVEQDASGEAESIMLAMAKAIGATRTIAVESNCEEETLIDLMGEQAIGGSMLYFTRMVYEVLTEAGCSPEATLLELYASGENIAVAKAIVEEGLWKQLKFHSHTSQYGHQKVGKQLVGEQTRDKLKEMLSSIRNGDFQREWTNVQKEGMRDFESIWQGNLAHPMLKEEDRLYKLLGRRE